MKQPKPTSSIQVSDVRAAADGAVVAMGCRCWLPECGGTKAGEGMMDSSDGEVGFSVC